MPAANVITRWGPNGVIETWHPTTLDQLGKPESFLEENLAQTPELLGLVSRRTGIHGPFVVFSQLPLDTPSDRQIYPDIVLLAASGHVIVVEVKLSVNAELRNRSVIAQIVDYAASFSALDDSQLMRIFGEDQNATTWFDLVQELFPNDTNVEELAETLRNRIAEGEINLVIVCDCIPPGVPDVVSGIASQETLAFDLDLVEVRPFVRDGDDAKEILFVPTTRLATEIVSRTAVSVTYREGDQQPSTDVKIIHASEADERGERLWSPEEVERDFLKLEDSTALEILEFAKQHSADGKFTPMGRRKLANICFYINDHSADGKKTRLPLFSTTCTWNCVYFNLKNVSRFSDESVDREFRSRLANLFDTNVEPDATWVGIGFDSISSSIDEFKELVLWFVANMKVTE